MYIHKTAINIILKPSLNFVHFKMNYFRFCYANYLYDYTTNPLWLTKTIWIIKLNKYPRWLPHSKRANMQWRVTYGYVETANVTQCMTNLCVHSQRISLTGLLFEEVCNSCLQLIMCPQKIRCHQTSWVLDVQQFMCCATLSIFVIYSLAHLFLAQCKVLFCWNII